MKEIKKIIRFKNNTNKDILEFVNKQSNFCETITYLIEKEIFENGIRDLMEHVPSLRTETYFRTICEVANINTNTEKPLYTPVQETKETKETKEKNNNILSSYED